MDMDLLWVPISGIKSYQCLVKMMIKIILSNRKCGFVCRCPTATSWCAYLNPCTCASVCEIQSLPQDHLVGAALHTNLTLSVTEKIMVNCLFFAYIAVLCDYVLQVMYNAHIFIATMQQLKKMVQIKLSVRCTQPACTDNPYNLGRSGDIPVEKGDSDPLQGFISEDSPDQLLLLVSSPTLSLSLA